MSNIKQFSSNKKFKLRSVCVACGNIKKFIFSECKSCGYTPARDYEIARAMLLSEKFEINGIKLGQPAEKLEQISNSIKSGRPFPFEHSELERVIYELKKHLNSAENDSGASGLKRILVVLAVLALITIVIVVGAAGYWKTLN